jgi:uncharacterized protein YceK
MLIFIFSLRRYFNHPMKAACLLPLVVLALSITGCSTINSRKQAHEAKVFPAVREHWNTRDRTDWEG